MSLLVMLLAFIQYLMAGTVVNGCFFMKADLPIALLQENSRNDIDQNATARFDEDSSTLVSTPLGLFFYQVRQDDGFQCRSYWQGDPSAVTLPPIGWGETSEIFHDASYRAARAFGTISLTILNIWVLMLVAMQCVTFSPSAIKFLAFVSFVAGLFSWLTLLLFTSELCNLFSCQFSIGASMVIPVSMLAMVNAALIYKLPLSVVAYNDDLTVPTLLIPGTTDVSETVLEDGSKKIVKTTVNQDGSLTVEETIVQVEVPVVEEAPPHPTPATPVEIGG
jgi:hypothetical protein